MKDNREHSSAQRCSENKRSPFSILGREISLDSYFIADVAKLLYSTNV
jgi:hypothetical protein